MSQCVHSVRKTHVCLCDIYHLTFEIRNKPNLPRLYIERSLNRDCVTKETEIRNRKKSNFPILCINGRSQILRDLCTGRSLMFWLFAEIV